MRCVRKRRNSATCFPYLLDESQAVAKAYQAACTPDFFLFDASRRLVYRGQFDDSRPGTDRPVTGADLRAAVDAVLAGRPPVGGPAAQPGLQHQVAARQRARVRRKLNAARGRGERQVPARRRGNSRAI